MSENIKGKVVIITGASSGMGEAAALHLGSLGAKVVLAARRKDRIESSAKEITASGVRHWHWHWQLMSLKWKICRN